MIFSRVFSYNLNIKEREVHIMNKAIYVNKPDFNLIAETLSYLLSKQYDADITVTMTPKSEEQLRKEGLIK